VTILFAVCAVAAGLGFFSPSYARVTPNFALLTQALDVILALGFATLALVSHLS
jgi:hypothetical protein